MPTTPVVETGRATYTPRLFLEEARSILAEQGETPHGFAAVGERLRVLGRQPGIIDPARLRDLHGSGATATILAEGPDGRHALMLARFPAAAPTPIHNHNSWGIACVVRGRDRYQSWKRTDDGADPDRARVELVEDRELETGDVVWFGAPPDDIHRQQGIGGDAWELVFFGTNPNRAPRAYFDHEHGTVSHDLPMR